MKLELYGIIRTFVLATAVAWSLPPSAHAADATAGKEPAVVRIGVATAGGGDLDHVGRVARFGRARQQLAGTGFRTAGREGGMAVLQGRRSRRERGAVEQADRFRLPGRPAGRRRPGQRPGHENPAGQRRAQQLLPGGAAEIGHHVDRRPEGPQSGAVPRHQWTPGGPERVGGQSVARPRPEDHQPGHGQRRRRAIVSGGVDAAFGGIEYFKLRDQGLVKVVYLHAGQDPAYCARPRCWCEPASRRTTRKPRNASSTCLCARRAGPPMKPYRDALFKLWERSGIPYASFQAEFKDQDLQIAQLTAGGRLHPRTLPGRGVGCAAGEADTARGVGGRLVRYALPGTRLEDARAGELLDPV